MKNKILRYVLKPYEIRRTMCRVRLIWLLRKSIALDWQMVRVEMQDEYRVWVNYTMPTIMRSITDVYLIMDNINSIIKSK